VKKLLLLLITSLFSLASMAQASIDTLPPYKKEPYLPAINLIAAPDSTKLTKENLKRKRKTLVIIFSPDCGHCTYATEELLKDFNAFKKINIVMATPLAYNYVKKFYDDYKLAAYPNIHVGYDKGFFLGTFYAVKSYPVIFLYDKKGNLLQEFDSSVKWETVANFL
jgi:thioredoxin-related protein